MRRIVVTAGLVAMVTACTGATAEPESGEPTARQPPPVVEVTDLPRQGPGPPPSGALLGAWVSPDEYTQAGRLRAVEDFERVIGRRLDVVHLFEAWHDPFPSESDRAFAASGRVVMLSWGGTDTRVIASGSQDEWIRQRARAVRDLGVPVLLRWRWEMDRPNLSAEIWSPQDYVAAWKHIRAVFAEEQVTNVGWVWCPHARGFVDTSRDAAAYYPGDDEVDWLCADVYAEPDGSSFRDAVGPFLTWAAGHPKPIIIGEFGIQHGDRATWFQDAYRFVEAYPQIKGLVYFHGVSKGERNYDHSLRRSPDALDAFRKGATSPHFNVSSRTGSVSEDGSE
jgi:hypothetical protein